MSGIRDGIETKVLCALLLLLVVRLTATATDPQMVEPGYYLEQIYEPSLVVPNHLAVSPSGIIVVTEWSEGRRVARVHEDGSVSTYAQPSSGHHFDVAFDAANNLYVGDGPNNLWRVSAAGDVTLVAEDVFGFSLDIGPSGDIYAAGGGNSFVQRVTPAGDVSVYAGGFVQASAVAVCPINEDVFVFDMLAGTIWRAVPGGAPVPLCTGLIHEVSGIDVAPDGTLYYAAMGHLYTVSRADGTRTEIAWVQDVCGNVGTGDFDSSGRLISGGTLSILRVDLVEETAEILWRDYGHSEALGVAPAAGGIFVGSTSPLPSLPGCVVRIESGGTVTPFVDGLQTEVCGFVVKTSELGYVVSSCFTGGDVTCVVHEVDMASGAKTEYAALSTHGRKLVVDPVTGRVWGLFEGVSYFDEAGGRHVLDHSSAGIVELESIGFTPDGTLYLTAYTTGTWGIPVEGALYRIDDKYGPAPSYVPIADLSTVGMCCPLGSIAGGRDGNIYWVGHGDRYTPGNGREMHMLRITPEGEVTLIGHQFPMDPFAITADPDSEDLYFTSGNGVYRVYRLPLEVVEFPDAGLETAVRDAIGKPAGEIYDWDLIGLGGLDAESRGIIDLEGIEHCTDLTQLSLRYNSITDVSDLAGLGRLEKLWLEGNDIRDIAPLAGLDKLVWLFLGDNDIETLDPLSGLTELVELELYRTGISGLEPLGGLTQLTTLQLYDNQIGDIGPLAGLTGLTTLLLDRNSIVDIAALSGLGALTSLSLADNRIGDIGPLAGLTGLVALSLDRNEIVDVGALSGLTALTSLFLGENQITSIGPLSGLSALQHLALSGNRIANLAPVGGLTDLRTLNLNDNPIGSIEPLSGLAHLEALWLDGLQLHDLGPLTSTVGLAELYANFNQVTDLAPLAGLTSLTTLELRSNLVYDITPLGGTTALRSLDLRENRIGDIGPLVANGGIGNDDFVDVRWNWLDLAPGSEDMADVDALLARGVDVQYDPQKEDPSTSAAFRVEIGGAVRCDETFHAAGFQTGEADVAEWVPVTTPAEPGTVLDLDPDHPGAYRICSAECSSLLAGVVSSAPGLVLGGTVESGARVLLALAGVVPVKVTGEGGPIRPGDLLVSAPTPGHAMRCREQAACPCCILGKALAPMSDERGSILVLLMTP